jgi:hypothetical protein
MGIDMAVVFAELEQDFIRSRREHTEGNTT